MPRVMIRVDGEVSGPLLSAFPQFDLRPKHVQTTLTGQVVDQEELQGVLNLLSSRGVTIVDVLTISADTT